MQQHNRSPWLRNLWLGGALLASAPAWSQVPATGNFFIARTGAIHCLNADGAPNNAGEKLNAPYSGVGITEMVQTLADGNRIVRQNTMRYFRDGRGRTRTEFELGAVGPVPLEGKHTSITINDPVANARYILHPEARQAVVIDNAALSGPQGAGGAPRMVIARRIGDGPPPPPAPDEVRDVITMRADAISTAPMGRLDCGVQGKGAPIALGERVIEGYKAVGSRIENTIPAGEIGNELPIVMSTEQWFSPELGVVLTSTHRDPMSGESTYRLTKIVRGEPDATLFTVPAGYNRAPMGPFQKFEVKLPPPGTQAGATPRTAPAPGPAPAPRARD